MEGYRAWDLRAGPMADVCRDAAAVVHCAALVGDWGAEQYYREVNVTGTQTVLDSFPTARIVYVSSSSVYSDNQPHHVLTEEASTGACRYSVYGRTKAAAERVVLSRAGTVVLRPHIVYGPGDTTLLPQVLASRRLGTLAIPGDGRNMLSVTHVENLVASIMLACECTSAAGVFNIADAETATLDDLLTTLLTRAGAPTRLLHVPVSVAWQAATLLERVWRTDTPPRGPPLTRYVLQQLTANHVLDITRARSVLGYAPTMNYRSDSTEPHPA
jgi:nucleoside-diphosphate-sugar epimerase